MAKRDKKKVDEGMERTKGEQEGRERDGRIGRVKGN